MYPRRHASRVRSRRVASRLQNRRCAEMSNRSQTSCMRLYERIKKESFRRGREAFFLFRGLSWSRGRNGKWYLEAVDQTGFSNPRCPVSKKLLLLLGRLLGRRLLGRRLLLGFSHGAGTSFQMRNVKLEKKSVNDFLR